MRTYISPSEPPDKYEDRSRRRPYSEPPEEPRFNPRIVILSIIAALIAIGLVAFVGKQFVATIFEILIHVVLFLAAIAQLVLIFAIIRGFAQHSSSQEIVMRAFASVCGLLIYVGAIALGLSIPSLAFKSLETSFPLSIGFVGILLPSMVGVIVSWYVITFLNSRDRLKNIVGMRVLALMVTLVFFLYCDSYIASFSAAKQGDYTHLLPNIVFVLSVVLFAVFKYHPTSNEFEK